MLFEMHPCGLHVCYPKKMGQFGFVQTVQDNMKLFSKRQLAGAQRARELHERLLYPSTSDYRAIVSAGGVPGSDVTLDDVKAAEVIWGRSVLKTWPLGGWDRRPLSFSRFPRPLGRPELLAGERRRLGGGSRRRRRRHRRSCWWQRVGRPTPWPIDRGGRLPSSIHRRHDRGQRGSPLSIGRFSRPLGRPEQLAKGHWRRRDQSRRRRQQRRGPYWRRRVG